MSLHACAALVERADPLRFRVAMAAPVSARRILFPLYAFNVEVARAPWVTQEAMIAEMRLQWWRDALEEISGAGNTRRHEVVDALADVLDTDAVACLDGLIAARRWDVYKDPFEDAGHFEDYINATSGHLMWTAARLLGPAQENIVRDFAHAAGVASFFQAVPVLSAQGRQPLLSDDPEALRRLAQSALDRMDHARAERGHISKQAGAALVAGYHARAVLLAVRKSPTRVFDDDWATNPAWDALRFANVTLRGWWR